jgi:hypothetical protein
VVTKGVRLRLLLPLFLACGGLHSGSDGGSTGGSCMHTIKDSAHLPDAPVATPLSSVSALIFDSQRQLWVLSPKWINVYSPAPNHKPIASLGKGQFNDAQDFALDSDGTIWVLDFDYNVDLTPTVRHLDANGLQLAAWPTNTSEGNAILLEARGTVLVATTRLDRFTRDGGFVDAHGDPADPNLIPFYSGLTADPKGFIWAGELNQNLVMQFSVDLDWLDQFGGRGSGPGMFDNADPDLHEAPSKLALDGHGDLYVNDPLSSRIMKLSRTGGSMLGSFDFAGSQDIGPLAVEPQTGNVYVGRGNGVDILCPL